MLIAICRWYFYADCKRHHCVCILHQYKCTDSITNQVFHSCGKKLHCGYTITHIRNKTMKKALKALLANKKKYKKRRRSKQVASILCSIEIEWYTSHIVIRKQFRWISSLHGSDHTKVFSLAEGDCVRCLLIFVCVRVWLTGDYKNCNFVATTENVWNVKWNDFDCVPEFVGCENWPFAPVSSCAASIS